MRTRKPAALVAGIVLLLAAIAPVAALADHVPPQTHDLGAPGSPDNECTNAFAAIGELQPGDVVAGWKNETGPGEPGNPDTDFETFTSGGFSADIRYRTVDDNRVFDFQNADPAVNAVVLKAGSNSNIYFYGAGAGAALTADTNLTAPQDSISHVTFCTLDREEPVEPEVTVTFTKVWTGDDEGDATASLLVDGDPFDFGDVIDVTDEQGNTLSLEEVVEGLDELCTYTSDLPAELEVPVVDEDTHIDIEVINEVECEEPVEPEVTVTFTKVWTGDDEGDATASLLVDGDPFDFGDVIDVTDEQGNTLSLEEVVEGLDELCTYTSDLPAELEVPVVDEDTHIDIEVINEVECEEPEEPEEPEVTVTFTKVWTGDDEGDATASLLVEDVPVDFGDIIDVTAVQGATLSLTEVVDGLAEDCAYTSDLPDEFDVPVADDEDIHVTIDVTNEVICTEVLGEVIERDVDPDEPDEVLGVVRTATTTTLPKTGASTLLLTLLGLSALGSGSALVRRRR